MLVRIIGHAPLAATVYSLEGLRCSACGQVFTAQQPQGVGPDKYDETVGAIVAQLKYGSGVPSYRLEKLESQLGNPLQAATQREIVEDVAAAAPTSARQTPPASGAGRGGARRRPHRVFTSGVVSTR